MGFFLISSMTNGHAKFRPGRDGIQIGIGLIILERESSRLRLLVLLDPSIGVDSLCREALKHPFRHAGSKTTTASTIAGAIGR